jgi:hypothetical protein
MKVSVPTKGSVMILKASALNGAVSLVSRVRSFPVFGSFPCTGGMSSGEGRKSTTASSSGCTPLCLNADPHSTGNSFRPMHPFRRAASSSASAGSFPSR